MRKLRGFVVLWGWVHLSVVPMCARVSPCCGSSSTGDGVLRVVHGGHGPIDIEALPCGVVAVRLGVRVWLDSVEASAPFLRQLLPKRGEGVSPWSQASRPPYLGKAWTLSHPPSLLPCLHVAREGEWLLHM